MINYRVVHHVRGRIRVQVPIIRTLSLNTLRQLASFPIPEGITNVSANPLTGSLVVTYDPERCDVLKCIDELMCNNELLAVMGVA